MTRLESHHLLAYNSTLAAVAGFQQVNAIADPVFPRANNGTEYQIPGDYRIGAVYAGAAANLRTRLITPTNALRANPQVVPISGTLLAPTDPNFMDMTGAPIALKSEETLRVEMESNSATDACVLIWVFDPKTLEYKIEFKEQPNQMLGLHWVRATISVTTVARTWALGGPVVFDEPLLEGGRYAVYGMQAFFATALAARLVFPGQASRPGCLGQATAVLRSAPMMWGGIGLWGMFDNFALPQLEVLDTAAATVTYTIWLLISKADKARQTERV